MPSVSGKGDGFDSVQDAMGMLTQELHGEGRGGGLG